MKTIVLDDDPTGTQSASNVTVLLTWSVETICETLLKFDSVYIQTNSRSLNEFDAVALARRIYSDGLEAGKILNLPIQFVLRGDSTLRGHVFSETEVFLRGKSSIIFLPSYPAVGRTTIDGEHYVKVDGVQRRADETEFARDPVFPFSSSTMVNFVEEKSGRQGVHVGLDIIRSDLSVLVGVLRKAPAGSVIVPDAQTDDDIFRISLAIQQMQQDDSPPIVRSAAPLAALLAGVASSEFITGPLKSGKFRTLLVAGSHTEGATKQLSEISTRWGLPAVVSTEAALQNLQTATDEIVTRTKDALIENGFASITSERDRNASHNTLKHGEMVMNALIEVVQKVLPYADVIVAKGGITSAEVARVGIGATSGWVLGQILPGISVWEMRDRNDRLITYVVVPGNVGNSETLVKVLEIVGIN